MPNVIIEFIEGRTIEQKREMAKRVTDALVETIHCKREAVTVVMHELSKDQVASGGVLRIDSE